MSVPTHGVQHLLAVKNADSVAFGDAGSVKEFELTQDREVIERYELGDPDPKQLVSGKKSVSGSFGVDWVSGNHSALGSTLLAAVQAGTEMWVGHYPEGDAAPAILANAAKFESWTLRGTIDGILENEVSYKGKTISES